MGIQGLMKLIYEECPGAVKEQEMDNLTGRKVAIDASMAMYQFLIAVRSAGAGGNGAPATFLQNDQGEVTSHIQGMFNRTIKMMSSGLKPVFVFDGKPPQMKGAELAKRIARRAKAESDLAAAREAGATDDIDRFSRRLVKVTRQHNEDCKELLRLMGVPYVDAPCEAEAQCAELAKNGKVYATATEDMDALTFRTPKLLRRLTFSGGKDKQAILEIDVEQVLSGMELTYQQFVDLCILCGCDYCTTIKGVGPKTALKLIKTYKTIEAVVAHLRKDPKAKNNIPDDWRTQKVTKAQVADAEAAEKAESEAIEKKALEMSDRTSTQVTGVSNDAPSSPVAIGTEKENCQPMSADNSNTLDIEDDEIVGVEEKEEEVPVDEEINIDFTANDTTTDEKDGDDVVVLGDGSVNEDDYIIIPPLFAQARELFLNAEVKPAAEVELKWSTPDEEGLRDFLVNKMQFNAERVANGIKKLQEAQKNKSQKRMDSFFTVLPSSNPNAGVKRKVEEAKGKGANKKGGNAFAKKK